MNELVSLSDLFNQKIFRIPDYQRAYAWKKQQLEDFWDDLYNLNGENPLYRYAFFKTIKSRRLLYLGRRKMDSRNL